VRKRDGCSNTPLHLAAKAGKNGARNMGPDNSMELGWAGGLGPALQLLPCASNREKFRVFQSHTLSLDKSNSVEA
jgi:hypothetical protein